LTASLWFGTVWWEEGRNMVSTIVKSWIVTQLDATMKTVTRSVEHSATDIEESSDRMLQAVSQALGGAAVRGWVIPTINVDQIEFPSEVFESPDAQLAVQVAHWRAPGAAWGVTVVYVVMSAAP
jgi:hypothetical protein